MRVHPRICDAAEAILRETDNPAVMWGDCGLLDMIAVRAGLERDGTKWMGGIPHLHSRVLDALSKQPGGLVAGTTRCGSNRRVRIFWLPEKAPKWARPEGVRTS